MSQSETSRTVELFVNADFDFASCQRTHHALELALEVNFHTGLETLLLLEIVEKCRRCGRVYESQLVPIERLTIQEALALPDATKPAFKSPPCSGDRADLRPTGAPPPKTAGVETLRLAKSPQ